jgi:hypothetical protein
VSGNTVTLSWLLPSTGGVPSSFVVEAARSPGGPAIASLPVPASPLTVPNVPNGSYYLRVRGVNSDGTGEASNEVLVVVPGGAAPPPNCGTPPNAPTNLTGTANGNVVTLNWSASAGGCPPAEFSVRAGSTPGASNIAVVNVGPANSLTASAPDGEYYLRIVALNAFGESVASNEVLLSVGVVQSPVLVYTNATDAGLGRVTLEDGSRVEYFGQKDANGLATQLRRIEINQSAAQAGSAYEFDASGRPTLLEANGVRTSIVWTSPALGTMTVRMASGEIVLRNVPVRVPAAAPISTPAHQSHPTSAAVASAGQFVRVRDACSQPVDSAIVHVHATPTIPIPFATDLFQRYPAVPQGGGLYRADIPLPDPLAGESLRAKCDTASSVAASLPCSRVAIGIVVVAADAIAVALAASGVGVGAAAVVAEASTLYGAYMTTACRAAAVMGAACADKAQALDRAARDGAYTLEAFARHEGATYAAPQIVLPVTGPFTQILPIDVPCTPLSGIWNGSYSDNGRGGGFIYNGPVELRLEESGGVVRGQFFAPGSPMTLHPLRIAGTRSANSFSFDVYCGSQSSRDVAIGDGTATLSGSTLSGSLRAYRTLEEVGFTCTYHTANNPYRATFRLAK